jgi:hypothetical protein
MSQSKQRSAASCHNELTSSSEYIVVFKQSATQETIDEQAKQVSSNGGKVDKHFNSVIMKVHNVYFA